jgi:hypothetical protein
MAIDKSTLQNVRQQSVIKFINHGLAYASANLLLPELKLADEILDQPNCQVNIQTVIFVASDSTAAPIVISRGPNSFSVSNVMYLHGTDSLDFVQNTGFNDKTLPSSNIFVLMPGQSTLYVVLGKTAGFQEPDFQANSRLRGV